MDDLISRQAAIEAIGDVHPLDYNAIAIRNRIRALPSAVVRCKDCKHVDHDATMYLVCNRNGMGLRPYHCYPDDFCSYGERGDPDA